MVRFGYVVRAIKSYLVEVSGLGGVTQNRFISPKGLFSKPHNEKAIVINLANGANQDVVMALQEDVELKDGDVYVTDDKSYIHFHFEEGGITVKSKKIVYDVNEFELNAIRFSVNGAEVNVMGGSVKHNGKDIGDTHKHGQGNDSSNNAQQDTTPPIN